MKTVFKSLLIIFILINVFIILSGNGWMYNAISITYLKGYTSTYIDDFVHFPANTIETGTHQEWGIANNYNNDTIEQLDRPL